MIKWLDERPWIWWILIGAVTGVVLAIALPM